MAKLAFENEKSQVYISCRIDWAERIREQDVEIFNKKVIRGLMKPMISGKRKIRYYAPNGISLQEYLKEGINEDDFYTIFVQIIEIIKKIKKNNLNVNNLVLDIPYIFINETTKEIHLIYLPFQTASRQINITAFLCDIAYSSGFELNTDVSYISNLLNFLEEMGRFSVLSAEQYVLDVYPEVYEKIRKEDYTEDEPIHEGHETPVTETSKGNKDVDIDDSDTGSEDDTVLLDEEDTMLLEENDAVQNIVEDKAYLIRVKTGERIDINTNVFTIGKENANYIISDNGAISRMHAEIRRDGEYYYFIDKNSTNGSYIGQERIDAETYIKLSNSDEITLANEKMEFHIESK